MRLRTGQRLFLGSLLLIGAAVVALSLLVPAVLRTYVEEMAEQGLRRELLLGRSLYDAGTGLRPDSAARSLAALSDHRVTIIRPDGVVVGESQLAPPQVTQMENHAARPEIRQALRGGVGRDVRRSRSIGERYLYMAVRSRHGDIVRFALPLREVDAVLAAARSSILLVGALALVGAALLSFWFGFGVTRPLREMSEVARGIARGDLSRRLPSRRGDELGELTDALNMLADELQRRISELEDERAETRAMIDSMTEGVLAIGADGMLRRANPAARQIFALREVHSVTPEAIARRPEFLDLVQRVLGGEHVRPTELSYNARQLLATAQPLPDGGAVLVFLDITELRRLESVRRDFVANASHELKTPLTAIRGYSETLLDPNLPPELRARFAEVVRQNADRLQRLVDDLLDLSRLESGGWQVRVEPLGIERIAREAWAASEDAAASKNIGLRSEIREGCGTVLADPAAVHQIFANLFANALRYSPPGSTVTVAARRVEDRRLGSGRTTSSPRAAPSGAAAVPRWVRVEVRDTGAGIASTHLPRIFERFYRADPARSRADGGTGLGLAIVRHLVEAHGGQVDARSRLGEGTSIRFTLPAHVPDSRSGDDRLPASIQKP